MTGAGAALLPAAAVAGPQRQAQLGHAQQGQAQPGLKSKTAESVPVTATEDLMREHGVLERILLIYEAGARRIGQGEDVDPAVFTHAAETMRDFVHDHHEKIRGRVLLPTLQDGRRWKRPKPRNSAATASRRRRRRSRRSISESAPTIWRRRLQGAPLRRSEPLPQPR